MDHLWGLGMYLVYVSGLALLDHDATITLGLGYWGAYGLPDAYWIS